MTDQSVTIVSFNNSERTDALQTALSESAASCEVLSCEQWLSDAAKNGPSALLFYFGRGMPAPQDINKMRHMAAGQKWRAVFEGPRPTKLPKSLLLPPRYFLWPEDREELVDWVEAPGHSPKRAADFGLLGQSDLFQSATSTLTHFARCDAPLLLMGETGSGKSIAARVAHHLSPRASGRFVTLQCGRFTQELGHNQAGSLFAGAQVGTLFLNDLEDLDPAGQIELLNWLQAESQLVPPEDAPRIIAASRQDLSADCAGFRADLYYRLAVLTLRLPALKDRGDDVLHLAQHFVDKFARQSGTTSKPMSDAFRKALKAYDWPGNVRELENFMNRAWVLSRGSKIAVQDTGVPGIGAHTCCNDGVRPYHETREATLRAFETVYLEKLMHVSGGNVTRAAELAGTERRSLGRMLKRNAMQIPATP